MSTLLVYVQGALIALSLLLICLLAMLLMVGKITDGVLGYPYRWLARQGGDHE